MPLNEEARALLGNILIVPDGEATEMTDATDLTAGEQVQQHVVQAWQVGHSLFLCSGTNMRYIGSCGMLHVQ